MFQTDLTVVDLNYVYILSLTIFFCTGF